MNDDAIGERQSLVVIMCDVDRRGAEHVVDASDFAAHFEAELGVEVGERLVHQNKRRLDDDRARDGDTLLLAAGEPSRQLRPVLRT